MDINKYLETNCGILENNSLIETDINQFQFYSIKHLETLNSINIFQYSKLFHYYYINNLFNIHIDLKDFTILDYQEELEKINDNFINTNIKQYENKYDEFDKLIENKNKEINELSIDNIKNEIKQLNIDKKEITTKLINITQQSFELISLNNELDKIDKNIKIKINKLNEIPNEIKLINKDIDKLKIELNKQLLLIKLFKNFPLKDYHIFTNNKINLIKEQNKQNKFIKYQDTIIGSIYYYFIIQYITSQYFIYDKFDILSLFFILILTTYHYNLYI